ncbi:MAG: hypothetical protein RIT81_18520 [Deltaproteobacteria bacterium]
MRTWIAVLVGAVACAPRVQIPLDPPESTESVVVATFEDERAPPRVFAFDRAAPPAPYMFEAQDDDRLVALYYDVSLASLGIVAGTQSTREEKRSAPLPFAAHATTVGAARWVEGDAADLSKQVPIDRIDAATCVARGGCWVFDRCALACETTEPARPMLPFLPEHRGFTETATVNACGVVEAAPRTEAGPCPAGRRTWNGGCAGFAACPSEPPNPGAFTYVADSDASLAVALAAAQDGDSIGLAQGTYAPFTVARSVAIVGACAEGTVIVSPDAEAGVTFEAGGSLSSLTIDAPSSTDAAFVAAGDVAAEDVAILGGAIALRASGTRLYLERALLTARDVGAVVETSSTTFDAVTIRGPTLGVACDDGDWTVEEVLVVDAFEGLRVGASCDAEVRGLHAVTSSIALFVQGAATAEDVRAEGGQGFYFDEGSQGTLRGMTFWGRDFGDVAGTVTLSDLVARDEGRGIRLWRDGRASVDRYYVEGGVHGIIADEGTWTLHDVCAVGVRGTPVVRASGRVAVLERLAIYATLGDSAIELLNEAHVERMTDVRIDGVPQGGLLMGPRDPLRVERVHITGAEMGVLPPNHDGLRPTLIDIDVGGSPVFSAPDLVDVRLESDRAAPLFAAVHIRSTPEPVRLERFVIDVPFPIAVRVGGIGFGIELADGEIRGSDIAVGCVSAGSEVSIDGVRFESGVEFDDRGCTPIDP